MPAETAQSNTQDKAPQLDSRRKTETFGRYRSLITLAERLGIEVDRVPRSNFDANPKRYFEELRPMIKIVIESVPDVRLKLTWPSSPTPKNIKKMIFEYYGLDGNDPVTFNRLNTGRTGSRNRDIINQAIRRCRTYIMRDSTPNRIEFVSNPPTTDNYPVESDIQELLS